MIDYYKLISSRAAAIKPSGIRKFFDISKNYENIISLGIGEPSFPTPWHIRKEAIHAIHKGKTVYTENKGMEPLRKEICEYLSRRFHLDYDYKSQTLITVGGSEAIDLAVRTLIAPGDEVIIPEPSFVCYHPITTLTGGIPIAVPTKEENAFKLTAEDLKAAITPKTKLLILPFPNNPTGAVMGSEDLKSIAAVLKDTNIIVLSDEIYCELTYGGEHISIASLDGMKERTIVVNGFSKSYAMTGWRLGYACGPAEIISVMTKLHQYAIMCSPTISQYAAVEALKLGDEDILEMRQVYDVRRRYLLKGLRDIGLCCFEPGGAFYTFPSIKSTGLTSDAFCDRLIREQQVAVIPGTAFGESGEGFIRVSYCYELSHIKKALERIGRFLCTLR